jgi:hypothetical protein
MSETRTGPLVAKLVEGIQSERDVMVAVCKCGGWVMVATLHYANAETWREASRMAVQGFKIRTPVPMDEYRAMSACAHRGDCTTTPSAVLDPAQIDLLEAIS